MMNTITKRPILILDFGSQYTQLIARRIRELGIYAEIHPYTLDEMTAKAINPCGMILSGGPATVMHETTPRAPDWVFSSNLPVLGICYGMQTMAIQLGGRVTSSKLKEFGYASVRVCHASPLLADISDHMTDMGAALLDVWMSHGDEVTLIPPGFRVLCETDNAPIAAIGHEEKQWYGLQFHPEVTHTTQGKRILEQFAVTLCRASVDWTPHNIVTQLTQSIRDQVGKERVLLGLSGGVDSSVVAALLHEAIGDQLVCVFVDTGLLRLHEKEQVIAAFGKHLGIHLVVVDAASRFLEGLAGICCPEEKRKKIGHLFIDIFAEEAKKIQDVQWLAQGTIYSDVIESAAATANNAAMLIKSHHNVGGLPQVLPLKLIEPIRTLFKDEVRAIGLALGLPHELIYRHPFPGAGLGVRILGAIKKEYAAILRQADAIFIEALHQAELYHTVSQAFAVFLPIKSVGVMGDGRCYDYVIGLRAVETVDFMTAHWARLPWEFLAQVSNRIINEVSGVSRVIYDISGKPPATIEWE